MFHDPPRRQRTRRRRRVLLPVVVTLVFLVLWFAGIFQSDNLVSTAFYDDVRSMATSQSLAAADFETMLITSAALDRAQYVALMDQLQSGVEKGLVEIRLPDVPPEDVPDRIKSTQSLADQTLRLWAEGLELFEQASLAIVDDPTDQLAVVNLGEALAKIKTGDVLYGVLAAEIDGLRIDLELPDTNMPVVAFLPNSAITPAFVDALQSRFANSTGLVSVPGLSIATVTTVPEPTGGQEGQSVRLPFTDVLEVQVVLSNNGNVPEQDLQVTVRIDDIATNVRSQETQSVSLLATGGQTTVRFPGLDVLGGEFYTVTVTVTTDGQGAAAPEPFIYEIFVAAQTIGTTTTSAG